MDHQQVQRSNLSSVRPPYWLGACMIGFIATWYYRTGLGMVLAWNVGASLVSGLILVILLRGRVE